MNKVSILFIFYIAICYGCTDYPFKEEPELVNAHCGGYYGDTWYVNSSVTLKPKIYDVYDSFVIDGDFTIDSSHIRITSFVMIAVSGNAYFNCTFDIEGKHDINKPIFNVQGNVQWEKKNRIFNGCKGINLYLACVGNTTNMPYLTQLDEACKLKIKQIEHKDKNCNGMPIYYELESSNKVKDNYMWIYIVSSLFIFLVAGMLVFLFLIKYIRHK